MMAAKDIVVGVGARYGAAFKLNPVTGLPDLGFNSGTLTPGTMVEGLKSLALESPQPQLFNPYGDDSVYAQDALPPTEIGGGTMVSSKTNLSLQAFFDDTLVVNEGDLEIVVGNTDKRGSEAQMMVYAYRQALDVQKGSSTFGKLRQWNMSIIPATRVFTNAPSYEQGLVDRTYNLAPTPVTTTPWAKGINASGFGANRGAYLEATSTYKPELVAGFGNGTLAQFALPRIPVSSAFVRFWVNGTLATVSSLNTSNNPSVTLSPVPGGAGSGGMGPNGEAFIFGVIEHNQAT